MSESLTIKILKSPTGFHTLKLLRSTTLLVLLTTITITLNLFVLHYKSSLAAHQNQWMDIQKITKHIIMSRENYPKSASKQGILSTVDQWLAAETIPRSNISVTPSKADPLKTAHVILQNIDFNQFLSILNILDDTSGFRILECKMEKKHTDDYLITVSLLLASI